MAGDDFYFERVTRRGGAALDVGCGTGMLACRIASLGLDVVGADPALGMLSVARARPGADGVQWIRSRAEDLDIGRRFRTVYMTGHAFQALIDDATAVAALRAVARHLDPDGVVLFETRNPLRRAWEEWGRERRGDHPSLGTVVEVQRATYAAETGIAHVRQEYVFESGRETLVGSCRVRSRDGEHVSALMREGGLTVEACLGDWLGGSFTPASEEIIIVAVRS